MIKLHSRHCLVAAHDGSVQSLDVEALRGDLRRSFHACGVAEDWTADHVALVIEEYASGTGSERPPLPERDLHAMVSTLLSASGYEDVGRRYLEQLSQTARPPEPDPFRPWDRARVEAELAGILPLGDGERQAIVTQTAAALASLGFPAVTSALIRDLGRHALQQSLAEPPWAAAADSPWLLLPDSWPVTDVPGARALCAAGAIRLYPVSRFLPRLRLELDLRCLAATLGTPPLPEIVYLPGVARALDTVSALLTAAVRLLAENRPNARAAAPHVVVAGLDDALAQALLPHSARAAKDLRKEVRAVVGAKLQGPALSDVLVTFR